MTSISSSPRKQSVSPSSPEYYHSPSPSPPLRQYHRSASNWWKRRRHYHSRHRSQSSSTERSRDRVRLRQRSRETHLSRSRSRERDNSHRHEYASRPSKHRSSHSHSAPRKRHRHYDRRNRSPSSSYEKRSRDRIPIRHSLVESHVSRAKSRDRHSRHRHDYLSRPSRYMRNYPLDRRNESPIARQSPLLLYRHFVNGLADNILPDEAFRRYEPYLHQLKKGSFASHKNDPGLKRLYHPSYIEIAINKRNEHANKVARNFFEDLQNGTLILLPLNPPGNAVRHLNARLLIAKVDAEK